MQEVVFVKLGGSFITYKHRPVTLNYEALEVASKILKQAQESGVKLIVGNGGGSFAHYAVLKYRNKDHRELAVMCHRATRLLNRIVVDYLIESGVKATSLQTSAVIYYNEQLGEFVIFGAPIKALVDSRIIPVLYGECIVTQSGVTVVSTERVFELVSEVLKPRRIVLLTDVSGVYTCNPKNCRDATLIRRITPSNLDEVLSTLKQGAETDATGGIYEKVKLASRLAFSLGIEVIITSGFDIESAVSAILGGTPARATVIAPK